MVIKFKELEPSKIKKLKIVKGKFIEKEEQQHYTIQYNFSYQPTHKKVMNVNNVKEKNVSNSMNSIIVRTSKKGNELKKFLEKKIFDDVNKWLGDKAEQYEWKNVERIGTPTLQTYQILEKKDLKKKQLGLLSYSYPYLKEADILFNNNENCVVNYLWYELQGKKYFKKLQKEDIKKYFENDTSFLQIEKFVMEYGHISMVAINPLNQVFKKYQADDSVITLTFLINNAHIYPVLNSDIKKSVNKLGYINLSEFVYNVNYENHQYIENNDNINKDIEVLLFEKDNLFEEAVKIIKETNTTIERILYDECNRIISFVHPVTKQVYEITKHYKNRINIIENINKIYDLNIKFTNQTFTVISQELFNSKYGNLKMLSSYLNNDVYDALTTYSISPYIARINEDFDISVMEAMDISKSYSSVLLNNTYDYPVYSIFDTIEPFDNNLTNGEYYINIPIILCNNTVKLPLGFYPVHMVKYALEKKAITFKNIKYQLKPKTVIKHDYFKKYVEDCYIKLENGKDLINHIIGTFGKKTTNQVNGFISNDFETICSMYYQEIEDNKEVSIHSFEGLHFFKSVKKEKRLSTALPVYRHIITAGIINLCNLYYDLKPEYVISYNTDCIVYVKNYDINTMIVDNEGNIYNKTLHHKNIKDIPNHINNHKIKNELDKVGKYRPEEVKPKGIMNKNINRDDYIFKGENELNIYDENTDLLSLSSAVIQGIAGAGKSHLIKNIVENKEEDNNILILCFTNVAVQNLRNRLPDYENIYTFDTFYNENLSTREKINISKKYNMIIIDEYSMVPLKHMTLLYNIKNIIKDIKFYFFGDKNQCLGVNEYSYSYDFIETKAFKEMIDYNYYECKYKSQYSRYDEKTFKSLNNYLENGLLTDFNDKKNNDKLFINLCKYNKTREKINNNRFKEHSKGKKKYAINDDTFIYIGMPIICVKTSKIDKIYNSERFKIIDINEEDETIKIDNDKVISYLTYINYFDMGFCFTVYKIQGATINEPYNIYDIDTMSKRELYTALSRTTKYEYINFEYTENNNIYVNNNINSVKIINPEPLGVEDAIINKVNKVTEKKETNINIEKLNEKVKVNIIKYDDRLQFNYNGKSYKVRHKQIGLEEAYKKINQKIAEIIF